MIIIFCALIAVGIAGILTGYAVELDYWLLEKGAPAVAAGWVLGMATVLPLLLDRR